MIALLALVEAIRLAPPLGRPLLYRTTIRDGAKVVTIDQRAVFAAGPNDGLVLTLTTAGADVASSGRRQANSDAAVAPLDRVPVRYRLDRGRPPVVVDADRDWATMLAGMRRAAGPQPRPETAAAIAAFEAMPGPARAAFLLGSLDDVVPAHVPALAAGEVAAAGTGTVTRSADAAGAARYHERSEHNVAGGSMLAEDGEVAVSLATGLVVSRTRSISTVPAAGGASTVLANTETRLLTPQGI